MTVVLKLRASGAHAAEYTNLIPDYFSTVEICQKENIYQVDFEIIQIIREAIPLNKDYISTTLKRIAHKKIKG